MNVKLLRKVKKHILDEPRRFNMGTWCEQGGPPDKDGRVMKPDLNDNQFLMGVTPEPFEDEIEVIVTIVDYTPSEKSRGWNSEKFAETVEVEAVIFDGRTYDMNRMETERAERLALEKIHKEVAEAREANHE